VSQKDKVELYSIGTELLLGQIQDTNAYWMAQQVARLGAHTRRVAILDDDVDDLDIVFRDAVERDTRILITTGGLGPTPDDLTVEVIARLKGVDVVVNEELVEHFMQTRDIARREDVRPGLIKMATSPEGSIVHPNPAGVAPCVETQVEKTTIYNLPGPPREVQALFVQCLEGPIADIASGDRISLRVAVNLPESELGPILHEVMEKHPNTYLKAYVALRERIEGGQRLPVDIVAHDVDDATARTLLDNALETFTNLVQQKNRTVERLPE